MSAQHTPGPWIVKEDDFQAEFVITTQQRQDESKVPICGIDVYFDGQIGIEQQANVNLIAAAPELLEALKDAMSLIEALMPGVRHIPLQDYAALNNTPLKARAAIAKAGGAA